MSTIKPLDKTVVNRIAAGEIIIAPANALKEMLENSIDAGSTAIDVLVKDGGVKLLQITDNGSGIDKADMPILCQRFTTSKLVNFEDLTSLTTYGFRGEALASISHVAHVTVTTKKEDSQCGWKGFYSDGELVPPKANELPDPKPVASKKGTIIKVEDFFYNVPSRLRALKSASEEFYKVLDVIGRYAVHTNGVGFTCKKFGESHFSVATKQNMGIAERIRTVFSNDIAANLIPIEMEPIEDYGVVKISGQITNPNYNNKKSIKPVFFINHRLVSNDNLKRAIMSSVNHFLPKGHKPFVYLSLEIKPENLDVNVHPTKREVRFLHEDEIIDKICLHLTEEFNKIDSSRTFKAKTPLLSQNTIVDEDFKILQPAKKTKYDYNLVRTDSSQAKITTYLPKVLQASQFKAPPPPSNSTFETEQTQTDTEQQSQSITSPSPPKFQYKPKGAIDVNLQSISELRAEVQKDSSRKLTEIFTNILYIGIIDETRRLVAVQYDVKLMLLDFGSVLNEFFYQTGLTNFSNFGVINLEGSNDQLALKTLLTVIYNNEDLEPSMKVEEVIEVIIDMREMLLEYFSIKIEEVGGQFILTAIPLLLKGYIPPLGKLPFFLYKLGTAINWEDEKLCLQGIMKQLALLYIPEPLEKSEKFSDEDPKKHELIAKYQNLNDEMENVLIPSLKQKFLPPKKLDNDIVEIANLPGLYKVFERC